MMLTKYEQGMQLLNKLHENHSGEEILKSFANICPKSGELTT